jgi:metallo-beta-lactamase family protein
MRVSFHGAAGAVTGSCYLIECGGRTVLLECGLSQGGAAEDRRNREPFPVDPRSIDAVVLSHAHIDHSGRLPLLVKQGFRGEIYAQRATVDLCGIMLRDSGYLQEKDAELESRKRARKGQPPVAPLYTARDAGRAQRRFTPLDYDEIADVCPGIRVRFRDAGHILGSAIVELWLTADGQTRKVVFSGDLGQPNTPILRDPVVVEEADAVLLESTYGDRLHRSRDGTLAEMKDILAAARASGGNVLIPAFAVGRTQELLYLFAEHFAEWGLADWRICLDSPMAIAATELYAKHVELHDAEAMALWRRGDHALAGRLEFIRTPEQSRALNRHHSGLLIIAASGMCEGGRIRHHLKNNAWRPNCHVVIVGYQARGTIGRQLVDGNPNIFLWGERIRVAATVHTLGGFSAHADQQGLLDWYGGFRDAPPVWLVHGEDHARTALAEALRSHGAQRVSIPALGDHIDLDRGGGPSQAR